MLGCSDARIRPAPHHPSKGRLVPALVRDGAGRPPRRLETTHKVRKAVSACRRVQNRAVLTLPLLAIQCNAPQRNGALLTSHPANRSHPRAFVAVPPSPPSHCSQRKNSAQRLPLRHADPVPGVCRPAAQRRQPRVPRGCRRPGLCAGAGFPRRAEAPEGRVCSSLERLAEEKGPGWPCSR